MTITVDEEIDWSVIDSTQVKPREQSRNTRLQPPAHDKEPMKLTNGKWECSHKCKDKTVYVPFLTY